MNSAAARRELVFELGATRATVVNAYAAVHNFVRRLLLLLGLLHFIARLVPSLRHPRPRAGELHGRPVSTDDHPRASTKRIGPAEAASS